MVGGGGGGDGVVVGGGVMFKVNFVSNPTTVLRLCSVVVGVVTIMETFSMETGKEPNKNHSVKIFSSPCYSNKHGVA